MYTLQTSASEILDIGSPNLYAQFQYGSNGQYVVPTGEIGDDQGAGDYSFYQWDTDTSDGFDTGAVQLSFVGESSGDESGNFGTASMGYTGDSFGAVGSVNIEAGVATTAEVDWSNLVVKFYSGNTLEQTDSISVGLRVDTRNTPSTPNGSQVLRVTTSYTNIDRVEVNGSLHMAAASGTYLGSDSVFCAIAVVAR